MLNITVLGLQLPWMFNFFAAALSAYLIGSLNGSLLVTRFFLKDDIRKYGSGNAGSTNMLRTYGLKLTLPVALWDMAKGVGAILLCRMIVGAPPWIDPALLSSTPAFENTALYAKLTGAFFVVAGHVFPLFFRFKGGKGVITSLAVLLMVDFRLALAAFACFLVVVAIWRYISLGSLVAFTVFTLLTVVVWHAEPAYILLSGALSLLVFYLHRDNIRRLLAGTERKLGEKKKEQTR